MAHLTTVRPSSKIFTHLFSSHSIDLETSDKLDEFFASGNGFALQKLLSEANVNDPTLDLDQLLKSDSLLGSKTLSEFVSGKKFPLEFRNNLFYSFLATI